MKNTRNWEQLKAEYLAGERLRQLAETYGIPYGTVRARASREGWNREKQDAEAAEPLAPARACVDVLLTAVHQALSQETALCATRQVKCKEKDGTVDRNWTEEETTGEIDIGKVKEYTAVLDNLICLKRDLYDLPNGAEAERRQLAREKLEMTKQKLSPQQAPTLQVLFTEEAADWAE